MYDCQLKRGLVIYHQNRTANVIIPKIVQHIKPGTEIWIDIFASYSSLGTLGGVSPYIHRTVNHSENFVNSVTEVCTNAVESYWPQLKGFLLRLGVIQSAQLPKYIDYFMWYQTFKDPSISSLFPKFSEHLKEKYPV